MKLGGSNFSVLMEEEEEEELRERFGQAVAYIRPLQTDLDESPLKQEVINTRAVQANA